MKITTCSVTVMRSHDYCHFSVTLGGDLNIDDRGGNGLAVVETDDLRKVAARLADKAVEQYKLKKRAIEAGENRWDMARLRACAAEAETVPEAERLPEHKAAIKALGDRLHNIGYDYDDQFTMLGDDE